MPDLIGDIALCCGGNGRISLVVCKLTSDKGGTGVSDVNNGDSAVLGKPDTPADKGVGVELVELKLDRLEGLDDGDSVSEGSEVFSSLLESSSNTDFLDKSCCAMAEGWEGLMSRLSLAEPLEDDPVLCCLVNTDQAS